MNWSRLTREQRTLVVGAAAIALIVVVGRVLPASLRWRARTTTGEELARSELDAARQRIAQRAAIRTELARARSRMGSQFTVALHGASLSTATASFVAIVRDGADAGLVSLSSVQVNIDTTGTDPMLRATARISGAGDFQGIATMLAVLRDGDVRVRVRELHVVQPAPLAQGSTPEALQFQLVADALARRSGGARAHFGAPRT